MRSLAWFGLAFLCVSACKKPVADKPAAPPAGAPAANRNPRALLRTNLGEIEIELFGDKAPIGVRNFLKYARSGAYDGTIFHRVVRGFVIQGGGFDANLARRPTEPPIQNEADNGLKNERGTVAWARTSDPHSATNQFFINLKDNPALDHRDKGAGWGYAVFGRVVRGLEVADRIAQVPVAPRGPHATVPVDPVIIERVTVQTP